MPSLILPPSIYSCQTLHSCINFREYKYNTRELFVTRILRETYRNLKYISPVQCVLDCVCDWLLCLLSLFWVVFCICLSGCHRGCYWVGCLAKCEFFVSLWISQFVNFNILKGYESPKTALIKVTIWSSRDGSLKYPGCERPSSVLIWTPALTLEGYFLTHGQLMQSLYEYHLE